MVFICMINNIGPRTYFCGIPPVGNNSLFPSRKEIMDPVECVPREANWFQFGAKSSMRNTDKRFLEVLVNHICILFLVHIVSQLVNWVEELELCHFAG